MLKYRTFDELVSSAESDLPLYADNGLINKRNLIKKVRWLNSDLGLRINQVKECILDVENYKTELPLDFLYGFSAYMVFERHLGWLSPGTHGTSIKQYTKEEVISNNLPVTTSGCVSRCGSCYWITRTFQDKEVVYNDVVPVYLTGSAKNCFSSKSPNRNANPTFTIDIINEEITTNIEKGTIYMSYIGDLIDNDENLLILDHPHINNYYELAVGSKMLEDIYYNSEADVWQKLQDKRNATIIARNQAHSLILKPEYREMNNYRKRIEQEFFDRHVRMLL